MRDVEMNALFLKLPVHLEDIRMKTEHDYYTHNYMYNHNYYVRVAKLCTLLYSELITLLIFKSRA